MLHGIFERARRESDFRSNPVDDLEPLRLVYDPDSYDFYDPEEVWALVRAAASDQDGAAYLTAAFAGLRLGEVVGLRVRDVDFAATAIRVLGSVDPLAGRGTTKGGRGRSVPMVPELAFVLARLLQRDPPRRGRGSTVPRREGLARRLGAAAPLQDSPAASRPAAAPVS